MEVTLANLGEFHKMIRDKESQIKWLEDEISILKSDIKLFLTDNNMIDKAVGTDFGSITIKKKNGVAVDNKPALIARLLGTEFESLITINHTSFPKQYADNMDFFEPLIEECGIRETEVITLSIRNKKGA